MAQEKTHYDYVNVIGETHATAKNYLEKRWNQYYFKDCSFNVRRMLGKSAGKTVLDVGTSHGSWFSFLKSMKFSSIYGVDIDPTRAKLAKECGYDEVYTCDAAQVPLADNSIDCAVSNDVFVHILRLEDKIAVLQKIERILKPGGVFILNHPVSAAFDYTGYTVNKYCSFLSLQEFISLTNKNTKFEIEDIKPTYFRFRSAGKNAFWQRIMSIIVRMPGGVSLLFFLDYFNSRNLGIQASDTVYLKLRKK